MRFLCFALLGLVSGCGAQRLEAEFSRDYTCPSHRVTGHAIDGPTWDTSQQMPSDPGIAADPERLATWRSEQPRAGDGHSWYEVVGCGRRNVYACGFPNPRGGDGCRLENESRE